MDPMVVVIGLPELNAQLNAFAQEVNGQPFAEAALTAGALPVQNRWKELAPVLTGTYRRDIHTEIRNGDTGIVAEVGTSITNPPYPAFLEHGTSRMAARPSMRPAFDEKQGEAVEEVSAVLNLLLAKYGGK